MNQNGIFPQPDHEDDPLFVIARKLGGEIAYAAVDRGFQGPLLTVEWSSREHLGGMKEHTETLNRAARITESLISTLRSLPEDVIQDLVSQGCVTTAQLGKLLKELAGTEAYLRDFLPV